MFFFDKSPAGYENKIKKLKYKIQYTKDMQIKFTKIKDEEKIKNEKIEIDIDKDIKQMQSKIESEEEN